MNASNKSSVWRFHIAPSTACSPMAGTKWVRPSEAASKRSNHVSAVARRGVSHASAASRRTVSCNARIIAPPAFAPAGVADPSAPVSPTAVARALTVAEASSPRRGACSCGGAAGCGA